MSRKKSHEHCFHIGGANFAAHAGAGQQPQWVAQPQVCCECGCTRVAYRGLSDDGHGAYVVYDPTPLPQVARPQIVLPDGQLARPN